MDSSTMRDEGTREINEGWSGEGRTAERGKRGKWGLT